MATREFIPARCGPSRLVRLRGLPAPRCAPGTAGVRRGRSKVTVCTQIDEFCTQIDDFCTQIDEFCTQNDGRCIQNDDFNGNAKESCCSLAVRTHVIPTRALVTISNYKNQHLLYYKINIYCYKICIYNYKINMFYHKINIASCKIGSFHGR